jgi:hypothetical protein
MFLIHICIWKHCLVCSDLKVGYNLRLKITMYVKTLVLVYLVR